MIKALREKCPNAGFFWSEFSGIRTEYRKIRTRKNSVFGHFSHSEVDTEGFVLNWENLPNDWLPKQNKYSVELTNSHGPLLKIQWKNFFFLFSHKPRPVQTSFVNQVMRDHWSSGHSRLRRRYWLILKQTRFLERLGYLAFLRKEISMVSFILLELNLN